MRTIGVISDTHGELRPEAVEALRGSDLILHSGDVGDAAILEELGERLARHRLDRGLTQADLAEQAGVGKRTVERVEAGESAQMATVIRILRVLGLLEALDRAVPEAAPSPLDLLKRRGKQRQRASTRGAPADAGESWSWGDEE